MNCLEIDFENINDHDDPYWVCTVTSRGVSATGRGYMRQIAYDMALENLRATIKAALKPQQEQTKK